MDIAIRMRILQAARELFNTRGYRSVTIQDLAEKLGMSKKTVYQYFSSKEEIATAVVEETMDKVYQVLHMPDLASSDPLSAIQEILVHVKDDTKRFGPLFLLDIEKYLPDLSIRFNQFRKEKDQHIEQLLQQAQAMGLVKDIPLPLAIQVLKVSLKAIVQSQLSPQNRFSTEDMVDLFLHIFCNGIAAKPNH